MGKYIGITISSIVMVFIGMLIDTNLGAWQYPFAFLWGAFTVLIGVEVMDLLDS